jgi:hypothetical protein
VVDHLGAIAPPSEKPREKSAQLDPEAAFGAQSEATDADLGARFKHELGAACAIELYAESAIVVGDLTFHAVVIS